MTKNKKEEKIIEAEFDEEKMEENPVETDMRVLAQVRDSLLKEFNNTNNINEKINLSNEISHTINSRQNSEVLFYKFMDLFNEEECPGCENCNPDDTESN